MKKNVGPGASTNIGYLYSNGDVITVHDSDDTSVCDRFEILTKEMSKSDLVILSYLMTNGKNIKGLHPDNFIIKDGEKVVRMKAPLHHCATLIRRSMWDKIGPYKEHTIAEDSHRMIKMVIYMMLCGLSVKMVKESLYNYFVHSDSHSRKNNREFDFQIKRQRSVVRENWAKIDNMSAEEFLYFLG